MKSPALTSITQFIQSLDPKDVASVLEDLLTPQEVAAISERLSIMTKLQEGKSQRFIAQELGISVTTVSRGSKVLQFGNQTIKHYLNNQRTSAT